MGDVEEILVLEPLGSRSLTPRTIFCTSIPECIGNTTNNRAEYTALLKGLDLCAKFTRKKVCCYCDSELAVNQMNGVWRLKNDELRELFHKVKRNSGVFAEVIFQHVNRTNQNIKKADKLLNDAFEGRCITRDHTR